MDDVLAAAVDAAEESVAEEVAAVLAEVADEFAAGLADANEIVAARFSVSRIAAMWRERVPRLVRRLLRVAETAAVAGAESVDAPMPGGWDDLPGRYDDDRPLPASLGSYVTTTEHLLRAVGDRLSVVAVAELAAGLDAGEDIEQLRARLRAAFDRESAQLGTVREELIARTESGRAWNGATLAVGQDLTGPDRPLVKQWVTRFDPLVRDAHSDVNGQLRLLDEPFTVAGVSMSAPGDPTAPPELVCNCRCTLALAHANRVAAFDCQEAPPLRISNARETGVTDMRTAAADGSHLQGAMIALMPTPEDAERLAIPGGESVDQLHLTLMFLGDDGQAWTADQRNELVGDLQVMARTAFTGPIVGNAFGVAHWNAGSDSPSWVWNVGDDRDRPDGATTLFDAHNLAVSALEDTHDRPELPVQHSPWAAHVCAAYSDHPGLLYELVPRLGPITFNRLRITFAGDAIDIPLGQEEPTMQPEETDETAAGMPARTWSTPDGTALAYENQETGDGRIFSAGSLAWDTGPWPLQYADEMGSGHDGAELAGAIENMSRDGDRLTGTGVIYTSRPAGQDAVMLLEEGAPLGVSVDLDDVDVEFVDRTINADDPAADEEYYSLAATLALTSASLLRLPDGAWMITARTAGEWTASGASLSRAHHTVQLITGPGGQISRAAVHTAFNGTGRLTAAAGDTDDPDGLVVHAENAGDYLLRITRARVRGATLVAMPAYDKARIVLDPIEADTTAAGTTAAAGEPSEAQRRVIAYVSTSPGPVGARDVAQALGMPVMAARQHLARATEAGRIVRLGAGQYVGVSSLPEGSQAFTADEAEDTAPVEDALLASAWTAMRDMPPMPAEWFREPTPEELPPGSGGVHYANGRAWGWVAQAGEPHAGMPGRNLTIDSLGDIDTTHFLRARFKLDDGTFARVGAYTMNAGHNRDGAECNDAACQFDDSRTVAAIVTVGMNERGMWFSGAAAPWLSEWDRQVWAACQPSYHMRQGPGGRWQLRAVLTVPVPGHSSPLLAAVAERASLALAASAAAAPDSVFGQLADMSASVSASTGLSAGLSANASGQHTAGTPDQRGQGADSESAHNADLSARVSGEITAALDEVLSSPEFMARFAAAWERRDAEQAAAREEVARLSAAVAPARQEIAAGMAGAVTTGGK